MKFRKKPVVIEAEQWTEERAISILCDDGPLIHGCLKPGSCCYHKANRTVSYARLQIDTLEGPMRADYGDWIIRGVAGEFYPCKPDIFAATYEPVEP